MFGCSVFQCLLVPGSARGMDRAVPYPVAAATRTRPVASSILKLAAKPRYS
jgi:hypothetical protein